MADGVCIVITVAGEVANWPGAVTIHSKLPISAFLISMVGDLWLCLMRGRWRWSGIALVFMVGCSPSPDTAAGYIN